MEQNDLNLEKLAGLAKLMNSFKAAAPPKPRSKEKPEVTEMDLRPETPALRTIKAAVPYVESRYRRGLGVMVKLIEIDRFLSEYNNIGAMSIEGENDGMGFLKAVVPNLPKENRKTGEMLIRLLEIREIAEREET
ncbi:MAG: hypothetical protein LUG24_01115 [Clostridiales bacterium]|nr:hypothetical protein [Clostridiales bacterium]